MMNDARFECSRQPLVVVEFISAPEPGKDKLCHYQ